MLGEWIRNGIGLGPIEHLSRFFAARVFFSSSSDAEAVMEWLKAALVGQTNEKKKI